MGVVARPRIERIAVQLLEAPLHFAIALDEGLREHNLTVAGYRMAAAEGLAE